ncbi:hypothetical protein [Vibrio jasicida]|nr:hypothetical protein [Vibrio jasicida]
MVKNNYVDIDRFSLYLTNPIKKPMTHRAFQPQMDAEKRRK